MQESQSEYWARRAREHATLAETAAHRAATAAHTAMANAYRRRAEEVRGAVNG